MATNKTKRRKRILEYSVNVNSPISEYVVQKITEAHARAIEFVRARNIDEKIKGNGEVLD